ncbi:MAG: helix-turn-helix domain-containing protein, partial [Candidatus Eremiobacterota bacterium]
MKGWETLGRLLTTRQVCERLSISRRHLLTLRKRGLFRTIRVSERSLRFDEEDIDAYLKRQSLT